MMRSRFARSTIFTAIVAVVALTSGCSSPRATLLDKDPSCVSSVEGFFESPSVWRGKAPALLVKEGRRVAPVYGELVEVTDEGIVFDPARVSPVD